MELASPFPEEPVTQIEADVPLEPLSLQAENADLELDLHSYERPLAVSPFGTIEHVPDWVDTRPVTLDYETSVSAWQWIRTDLGVHAFQSLGKKSIQGTASLVICTLIPSLSHWTVTCIPRRPCIVAVFQAVGYNTPATRDIETWFTYRTHPLTVSHPHDLQGGGPPPSFSKLGTSVQSSMGTETLLSMQKVSEKECEDNTTELVDSMRSEKA